MYKTTLAALTACMLLVACDDSAGDGADDPSGGSGATGGQTSSGGGSAEGGGGAEGGAGGGGASACPLDATGKLRVAAIAAGSAGTAGWIVMNTHGHGMGAGRGFGTVVPLTTEAALYSASLIEPCTGPSRFAPYCEPPEPADPPSPFTRCSQLICEGAGELTAKLWIEGLPATVPTEPPPGDTTVVTVDHATHFLETGTEAVELTWQGSVELSFGDGATAAWAATGTGNVDDTSSSATIADEITGLLAEPITVEMTLGDDGPSGQIEHAGTTIAQLGEQGVEWLGACAP